MPVYPSTALQRPSSDALQYPSCRICGTESVAAGSKVGHYARIPFRLFRCPDCRFAFVDPPWSGLGHAYNEDYYRGKGVDWTVDYVYELEAPHATVRHYEWRGFTRMVGRLAPLGRQTRWLDYGCGNGGLVRYLHQQGMTGAVGFDRGWIADRARDAGIPILQEEEFAGQNGQFDVVTMLEVIEHVLDPLEVLQQARRLLKPNGILYLTTGNARPHRHRLADWRYVLPEIHVSFFEPRTLEVALSRAGFRCAYHVRPPGYSDMMRFKILKNLGIRKRGLLERAVPWRLVGFCTDLYYQVTYHPYGVAVPETENSR
jgi:SAM-dependent methyltransferase